MQKIGCCQYNSTRFIVLLIIITLKALFIGLIIVFDVIDLTFFTYINYLLTQLSFIILALIETKMIAKKYITKSFRFYALFILPITFGLTTFVAITIIIIVGLNSDMLMKSSQYNNGPNALSQIYVTDKIIHPIPLIELLIILLFYFRDVRYVFNVDIKNNDTLDKLSKTLYWLYFFLSPLFIVIMYMINVDFIGNYPVPVNSALVILIVIGSSIFIQLFFFLITWSFSKNNDRDIERNMYGIKKKN